MEERHGEATIRAMNKKIAEDIKLFAVKDLVLPADIYYRESFNDYIVTVYNITNSEIKKVEKHRDFREASISFFEKLDRTMDLTIEGTDYATRNYIAPALKATGRGVCRAATTIAKYSMTAFKK